MAHHLAKHKSLSLNRSNESEKSSRSLYGMTSHIGSAGERRRPEDKQGCDGWAEY